MIVFQSEVVFIKRSRSHCSSTDYLIRVHLGEEGREFALKASSHTQILLFDQPCQTKKEHKKDSYRKIKEHFIHFFDIIHLLLYNLYIIKKFLHGGSYSATSSPIEVKRWTLFVIITFTLCSFTERTIVHNTFVLCYKAISKANIPVPPYLVYSFCSITVAIICFDFGILSMFSC